MSIIGQGVIPSDWEGEYCRYAVCWPNSDEWLAVLRGVLTLPARGRFWDAHTGTIIEAQAVIRETFDTNLHLQEVIMACGDTGLAEIAAAIELLAQTQQNQNCCDRQGSGGSGDTPPPFSEVEAGNPVLDPPPEGFESWEEFLNQKCSIAWNIVETLENDMGNMIIINLSTSTLSGLASLIAITIITPIPFDDIIAIAAFLISVGSTIVISTALDIINTNEEVLVCALYNGSNATSSRDLFLSEFDTFVDSGVSDPIENFAIKQFTRYMIGSPVTNRLYEKDLTKVWPERDCSACIDNCSALSFEFEAGSTDGWTSSENAPSCFEFTLNGTPSLASSGGILTVGVASGTPKHNAMIKRTGIDYVIPANSNWQITTRQTGATTTRIQGYLIFDDDTCASIFFASGWPNSATFAGNSIPMDAHAGKTINEMYIYMRENADGGDGYTLEFENIFFFCD